MAELAEAMAMDGAPRVAAPTRGVVFLSHATPQENAFVTWLAAQLVSAGYEVWCDLTKLLGGERFWNDIEEAIRDHTFRFLFVSTQLTHTKPGTLRELKLAFEAQEALGIDNFVVPLKIDVFPFSAMDERLRDLNIMRFDEGWPSALVKLLKLLEREGAPKSPLASPAAVTEWHRRSLDPKRRVQVGEETTYTNWFRTRLPKTLWFHDLGVGTKHIEHAASTFARPYRVHGEWLVTFAAPPEVNERLGPVVVLAKSHELRTEDFIQNGDATVGIASGDASNIVTDLIARAWNSAMEARGLISFEMASGQLAWFFKDGALSNNNKSHYVSPSTKKKTYRQLVGHKSKRDLDGGKAPDGFWHYAVSATPQLHPFPKVVLRHHVIFSDDGKTPWPSAERMHKARRSVCKQWWNGEWRDRLFAIVAELGDDKAELGLPVADDASVVIAMRAMEFTSPRRFFEDGQRGLDETSEIELVEDADEPDDEDDGAS